MKSYTLQEIADILDCSLVGEAGATINKISSLQGAEPGSLTFLSNSAYAKQLPTTQATAVIVAEQALELCKTNALVSKNPYLSFAKASQLFTNRPALPAQVHPSASIGEDCQIDASVRIGANVSIGARVEIGAGTEIYPGCVIGDDVVIGENCRLFANVTIYYACKLGNDSILHAGVVLGSDGFGIAPDVTGWTKIEQLGRAIVGNRVEIGANSTIDRGAIGDTVIEDGVKIDNQVQIAHNVRIGENTAIAGCAGVAGSTTIGKWCMIGGRAAINGHIHITDQVTITGNSGVSHSITKPGVYSSALTVQEHKTWKRTLARIHRLDKLVTKIKFLEKYLNKEN